MIGWLLNWLRPPRPGGSMYWQGRALALSRTGGGCDCKPRYQAEGVRQARTSSSLVGRPFRFRNAG